MNNSIKCPVCLNVAGGTCRQNTTGRDSVGFECDICGRFELTGTAYSGPLDPEKEKLTSLQRAALSHRIREATDRGGSVPVVDTVWLKHFLADPHLPTPAVQAINAIRFIGDEVSKSGKKITNLQPQLYAIIGAPNPYFAADLVFELKHQGLIDGSEYRPTRGPSDLRRVNLTLEGWTRYESEKRGRFSGKYGFLAMKFGDGVLDAFVENVLKPDVKAEIGYDVVDMRDVARAGIIDNIMRAQIRDAAFVIVDLTHDNAGAYWEAGYAEGLGKPVIYICEAEKFAAAKTHFDTNHCTTVPWKKDEPDSFSGELIATLRRSLNLFAE